MNVGVYQRKAARTINRRLEEFEIELHAVHGLASEVGEIHGIYQKEYQGHPIDDEHLINIVNVRILTTHQDVLGRLRE